MFWSIQGSKPNLFRVVVIGLVLVGTVIVLANLSLDHIEQTKNFNEAPRSDGIIKKFCARKMKKTKVGIIGAGLSGLYTARELIRAGVPGKNIIIYEKEDKIIGSAKAFTSPQPPLAQDVGTIIVVPAWQQPLKALRCKDKKKNCNSKYCGIPFYAKRCQLTCQLCSPTFTASDVNGGVSKLVEEYIARSRVRLTFNRNYVLENRFQNFANVPFPLKDEAGVKLQMKTIDALVAVQASHGIKGVYDDGLALKTENAQEWQDRLGVDNSAILRTDLTGGMAPSATYPAAMVMKSLALVTGVERTTLLLSLQANQTIFSTLDPKLLAKPFWQAYLNPAFGITLPFFFVREGIDAIFAPLVDDLKKAGVEIRFNEPVTKLTSSKRSYYRRARPKIRSKSGTKTFDHVFVSSRPQDSVNFIDEKAYPSQKKLYSEIIADNFIFLGAVIEPKGGMPAQLINKTVQVLPEVAFMGTPSVANARTCAPYVLLSLNKFQLTALAYQAVSNGKLIPKAQCNQILLNVVSQYLGVIVTTAEIKGVVYWDEYPSSPTVEAVKNGWYDKMESNQGKKGVFFTGEVFSGLGINGVPRYVVDDTPKRMRKMCRRHLWG